MLYTIRISVYCRLQQCNNIVTYPNIHPLTPIILVDYLRSYIRLFNSTNIIDIVKKSIPLELSCPASYTDDAGILISSPNRILSGENVWGVHLNCNTVTLWLVGRVRLRFQSCQIIFLERLWSDIVLTRDSKPTSNCCLHQIVLHNHSPYSIT